jgi:hypothetical protein
MRRASPVTAASMILVAAAFALFHAARNRVGDRESEITLTNRSPSATNFAPDRLRRNVSNNLSLQRASALWLIA